MNKKEILVIDAHPDSESYCVAVSESYYEGAKQAGHSIKKLVIRDLVFDPILHYGYRKEMELEPDLLHAQSLIRDAGHIVIITPLWWGGLPGLVKGFIDRTFLRGFSHRFDPKKKMPDGLLKGKTARVIYTQGAPFLYSFLFTGDAFWNTLKSAILEFCGLSSVKRTCFDRVKSGTDEERKNFLEKIYTMGEKAL